MPKWGPKCTIVTTDSSVMNNLQKGDHIQGYGTFGILKLEVLSNPEWTSNNKEIFLRVLVLDGENSNVRMLQPGNAKDKEYNGFTKISFDNEKRVADITETCGFTS